MVDKHRNPGLQSQPLHRRLEEVDPAFAEGAAIPAGSSIEAIVPIAGAEELRFRGAADVVVDLEIVYLLPPADGNGVYDLDNPVYAGAGNPAAVTTAAGTDDLIEDQPKGEVFAALRITNNQAGPATLRACTYSLR